MTENQSVTYVRPLHRSTIMHKPTYSYKTILLNFRKLHRMNNVFCKVYFADKINDDTVSCWAS